MTTAKPTKPITTTKRKPKPKIEVTHTLMCTREDAMAITEGEALEMVKELRQICKKKTKGELLDFIIEKVNNDRKWRAWVSILLYKMSIA